MSTVKDIFGALRDVLVMNSKIDATAEAVRELTQDVKALQQEVAELRGMLRGAVLASGLALPRRGKDWRTSRAWCVRSRWQRWVQWRWCGSPITPARAYGGH